MPFLSSSRCVGMLGVMSLVACFRDWDGPLEHLSGDAGAGDATVSLCAGALFCENFDEHPLEPTWDTHTQSPTIGGSITITPFLTAPSAPNVLTVRGPIGSPESSGTWIEKGFTVSGTVKMAFDFYLDTNETTDDSTRAEIAGFVTNDGTNDARPSRITIRKSAATFEQKVGNVFRSVTIAKTPAVGKWTHIVFTLGGEGGATVSFDGEPVMTTGAPSDWVPSSKLTRVIVGLNYTTIPTSGWVFRYDNVRVDNPL